MPGILSLFASSMAEMLLWAARQTARCIFGTSFLEESKASRFKVYYCYISCVQKLKEVGNMRVLAIAVEGYLLFGHSSFI